MSLPQVNEAMWDWETAIKFHIVKKKITDFEVEEQPLADTYFLGVLQPIPPQKIAIRPEGERKWKWWTLWTQQNLEIDMTLEDQSGKVYRVMSKSDWNAAGYLEYELAQGVSGE